MKNGVEVLANVRGFFRRWVRDIVSIYSEQHSSTRKSNALEIAIRWDLKTVRKEQNSLHENRKAKAKNQNASKTQKLQEKVAASIQKFTQDKCDTSANR